MRDLNHSSASEYPFISVYDSRIPFFTVVLCTYNRAQLLQRAVDSLISQDELDWELVVIDDGSIDNSYEIIKNYSLHHSNIRYMFHTNRGLGASRNAGLLASCGLYITFLDSDDEYLHNHLYIRKQVCVQNPEIDFFHGGVDIIGNPYVPDKSNISKHIHLNECAIGGTFVIRREVALRLGGFPHQRFADDATFFEKARASGVNIAKIDAATYRYYRDTPDSLCNTMAK